MRFTKKNNAVANRKMKHAFKILNGSYTGGPAHAPQNRFEGPFRKRWAGEKAKSLRSRGYSWQAERIYNYQHRLEKDRRL